MRCLSQHDIKEMLFYDALSGVFTWRKRPISHFSDHRAFLTWNNKYPDTVAGSPDNKGYLRINFGTKKYKAHRLAWLYVHGEWPDVIDHINGIKHDNRISNLRSVSFTENMRNRRKSRFNSSGANGVAKRNPAQNGCSFTASIAVDGKPKYLGSFHTLQEAIEAREAANRLYGYHENHGK